MTPNQKILTPQIVDPIADRLINHVDEHLRAGERARVQTIEEVLASPPPPDYMAAHLDYLGLPMVRLRAIGSGAETGAFRYSRAAWIARGMVPEVVRAADGEAQGVYVIPQQLKTGTKPANWRSEVSAATYASDAEKQDRRIASVGRADIDHLVTMYIDIDPLKPAGIKGMATRDESMAAVAMAAEIYAAIAHLLGHERGLGFLYSGNGAQVWLRHAAIASDADAELDRRKFLVSLSQLYPQVDSATWNADRIGPLAGTQKRKGDSTAARPYRTTAFWPGDPGVLTAEDYAAILHHFGELSPPKVEVKAPIYAAAAPQDLSTPIGQANAIPIETVLRSLGAWSSVLVCPHGGNHERGECIVHGESNAIKCFRGKCQGQPHSYWRPLDAVKDYLGVDFKTAYGWMRERWELPEIGAGNKEWVEESGMAIEAGNKDISEDEIAALFEGGTEESPALEAVKQLVTASAASANEDARPKRKVKPTRLTIGNILATDERLKKFDFYFDEFSQEPYVLGQRLCTTAITKVGMAVEKLHGCNASQELLREMIPVVCEQQKRHPVRDYINGLVWDQTPRIDRLLVDQGGATDTAYTRAVTAKWMISAVSRILNPGCKVDTVLVLLGTQSAGKSTFWECLSPNPEWVKTDLKEVDSKDAQQSLRGKWLVAFEEMAASDKSSDETMKQFITQVVDDYRAPYERFPTRVLRQCIFGGSTNNAEYLRDPTGNRRYWTVEVDVIATGAIRELRDQLWGEAVHRYRAGERWWFDRVEDAALITAAADVAEGHRAESRSETAIRGYIAYADKRWLTTAEIIAGAEDLDKRAGVVSPRAVASTMRSLGWAKHQRADGARTRGWKHPAWTPADDIEVNVGEVMDGI